MDDSRQVLGTPFTIRPSEDLGDIAGSDIVVVTAGLARKPGMTREDLLNKNAHILKNVCAAIRAHAAKAIVIIVTNPLDVMTMYALKETGFDPRRLFGMGVSLDASRFANLISEETGVSVQEIEPVVIASHGEGMLPLPAHTRVKGKALTACLPAEKLGLLVTRTVERGKEIVSLYGSGSAYFAPSAAIAQLVQAIAGNTRKTIGVCCKVNGEYGQKDVCIGLPCVIGANGIDKVVELKLDPQEKKLFDQAADSIRSLWTMISS
jgi:malate dehydrogenase